MLHHVIIHASASTGDSITTSPRARVTIAEFVTHVLKDPEDTFLDFLENPDMAGISKLLLMTPSQAALVIQCRYRQHLSCKRVSKIREEAKAYVLLVLLASCSRVIPSTHRICCQELWGIL